MLFFEVSNTGYPIDDMLESDAIESATFGSLAKSSNQLSYQLQIKGNLTRHFVSIVPIVHGHRDLVGADLCVVVAQYDVTLTYNTSRNLKCVDK